MKKWRSESVLDVYNVVLAAVLFVSPWLFRLNNGTAVKDLWITGAAIVAISLAAIMAYADWEEWANFLVGIWLMASPWTLGFAHMRAAHFAFGFGAVVTFLAALELWLMYEKAHPVN